RVSWRGQQGPGVPSVGQRGQQGPGVPSVGQRGQQCPGVPSVVPWQRGQLVSINAS
ncbi:hypothetical protein AALO_G00252220, partial [Alosa alosa]